MPDTGVPSGPHFGSAAAAQQLGISLDNLHKWLSRHPGYKPAKRISDDLLWSHSDIETVRHARGTSGRGRKRRGRT